MTSFLQQVFGRSLSTTGKAPSFNDFSLHVADDAENELDASTTGSLSRELSVESETVTPKRTNVWQDTFSPQMNSNLKKLPASYYDAPKPEKKSTVWDEIIKADAIRKVAFEHFDKNNDGMIDADDLRSTFGKDANVVELIKAADKNKDGLIDRAEFTEMLKNM